MNSRNKTKNMYRLLRFQEGKKKDTWIYSNSEEVKSLEKKNQRLVCLLFELAGV
jgi:hypothetical protein